MQETSYTSPRSLPHVINARGSAKPLSKYKGRREGVLVTATARSTPSDTQGGVCIRRLRRSPARMRRIKRRRAHCSLQPQRENKALASATLYPSWVDVSEDSSNKSGWSFTCSNSCLSSCLPTLPGAKHCSNQRHDWRGARGVSSAHADRRLDGWHPQHTLNSATSPARTRCDVGANPQAAWRRFTNDHNQSPM